jgi:hypothetical protein
VGDIDINIWQRILLNSTVVISVLTAIIFIVKYKFFTSLIKHFGLFVILGAATEFVTLILARLGIPNLFLLHIFSPFEFLIIGFFFIKLFRLFNKNLLNEVLIYIGTILIIFNSVFIQPLSEYNSFARTSLHLFFMGCCFIGFYLFTIQSYNFKDRGGVKIILMALLLKYSGSMFLYLFSKQIGTLDVVTQRVIWIVNPSLNFISQAIILVAFIQILLASQRRENDELSEEIF